MDENLEKLIKKIESGRQFRRNDWKPELRALDDTGNGNSMIVEGHATTFDEEYLLYSYNDWDGYRVNVYEKVDRHAFDNTDMTDVIFLFDHRGRVMARSRNRTLQLSTDEIGLLSRADLAGSDLGPGLYKDIRNGYVDRMSMQFTVRKDKSETITDTENGVIKYIRTILDIGKLYDVSAVGIPANDGTDISARSFADGVIRELEAERLNALEKAKRAKALSALIDLSVR